jgi:hypothetical protein
MIYSLAIIGGGVIGSILGLLILSARSHYKNEHDLTYDYDPKNWDRYNP